MIRVRLPYDYKMSEGEFHNLVEIVCTYTIGWTMRTADLEAVRMLVATTGPRVSGDSHVNRVIEVTCEYLWDNVMGEPEDLPVRRLVGNIEPVVVSWYESTTPEERSNTK